MEHLTAQKLSELVVPSLGRSPQLFMTQDATTCPALLPQDSAVVHNVMIAWPYLSPESDNEMLCCRFFKGVL